MPPSACRIRRASGSLTLTPALAVCWDAVSAVLPVPAPAAVAVRVALVVVPVPPGSAWIPDLVLPFLEPVSEFAERLSRKTYPDSSTVIYTYDPASRLTQVVDPTRTYSFSVPAHHSVDLSSALAA
jgi:YD repeat-containing protein